MLLLASRGLSGTRTISSHFAHSLRATGALPGVALVLNPRVGGVVYVLRPCGSFKWSFLKIQCCFCRPNPHWFLQPEVTEIYLPGAGALCCAVWLGAGIACSQGIPSSFYTSHVNVGLPVPVPLLLPPLLTTACLLTVSASLRLLPVWMNVAPLNYWLSDFHTVQFSDGSGCYLF